MAGARVKLVGKHLKGGALLLTCGDGGGSIDIASLLKFHHRHSKLATVTGASPPGRFGEITIQTSRVVEFNEKPQSLGDLINGVVFVFQREAFRHFSKNPRRVLEEGRLRNLAANGQLACPAHQGSWQLMDTCRAFEMLSLLWRGVLVPRKIW